MRIECLNEPWFLDLEGAQELLETWRIDYNTERPHSSLKGVTPGEFTVAAQTPLRASFGASLPSA
ncbi:MAG: transposase [Verrucomicrobiae bacterium]|nr:transposase [Verrucomicrobiae bacterium]